MYKYKMAVKKIANLVVKYNIFISFFIFSIFLMYMYVFFTFLLKYYNRKEGFAPLFANENSIADENSIQEIY